MTIIQDDWECTICENKPTRVTMDVAIIKRPGKENRIHKAYPIVVCDDHYPTAGVFWATVYDDWDFEDEA